MKNKSEIFLDLRKLTKEEIMSIPQFLFEKDEPTSDYSMEKLSSADISDGISFLIFSTGDWHRFTDTCNRTEITFTEFKSLFRDYEGEMLLAITELRDTLRSLRLSMMCHPDCYSESEFDDLTNRAQQKEDEYEILIKEVEQKRNNK